jgi:hypothetical protein
VGKVAERAGQPDGFRLTLLEGDVERVETLVASVEERVDSILNRVNVLIGSIAVASILLAVNIALIAGGVIGS